MSLQALRAFTFMMQTKDSGHDSQNFSVKTPFNHRIYFLLPIDIRFPFLCLSPSFQNAKFFPVTSQCLLASKKFWQRVAFIHSFTRRDWFSNFPRPLMNVRWPIYAVHKYISQFTSLFFSAQILVLIAKIYFSVHK